MAGSVGAAALLASLMVGASPAGAIVPGANGRIAFESNRTGNNEIFTMNPDGSVPINLTNDPPNPLDSDPDQPNDVFPAWSPDGTRITYSSDRHETGNLDVYVMNADGSRRTQLTNSPGEDRGTSWTSDGQRIVFHSSRFRDATHTFDVFTMNPDGTNQTKIFTNGSAAYVCGDSSTGRIVFNSSGDPLGTNPPNGADSMGRPILELEIFTMDLNGANVVQVTNNAVRDSGPKWSPDCSKISYNSTDTTSLDVHRISANGTGDVNLTHTPGIFDAFSAWSPDGTRIVFSSNRDVNFEIYTMSSTDGSDVNRLTFTDLGLADLRSDWGTAPIEPPPVIPEAPFAILLPFGAPLIGGGVVLIRRRDRSTAF